MGGQQPGKAVRPSARQIYRQLQITVNEALKILDSARLADPANQAEAETLRSLIWSELTGLETEFGREEGPRPDRIERFLQHLLSSGDHVGQIEALGSALLGGAPPPSQPPPDSPVAGLHSLHGELASIRRQWEQSTQPAPQPAPEPQTEPARQPLPAPKPAPARKTAASGLKSLFMEDDLGLPESQPVSEEPTRRGGRSTTTKPPAQADRKPSMAAQLFAELGLGSQNGSSSPADPDAPRPRAMISFLLVIFVLGLIAASVIYFGLSSGAQGDSGSLVLPTGTIPVPTLQPGATQPTATLNPAPPQLQVLGNPLHVPCPGSQQKIGFVIKNSGGQTLTWSARVNPVAGSPVLPVLLDKTSGNLYGESATALVTVNVTAQVTKADGTITITSNVPGPSGTQIINYHIGGC